ncbi:hypothetical protein SAMN05444422_1035 [Halobiforma haloterrestris]|uniref:Uncharacterized protein n=1 Tax=Natronobacterium haloterrestre TaxID=148448 RepID=A0A1I1F2U9_NATHA|nr:hypothetical protein [Halobiforma haloterrestris]SFB91483.1 hypothetical protein SAMN05444422_1035 [Halobiforma haloterrestris]
MVAPLLAGPLIRLLVLGVVLAGAVILVPGLLEGVIEIVVDAFAF